ncbi:MAG TPA: metallophosphoesterase family protein [Terriglobales bacterium]|nr:metallophosphoesterase family protein [Terriglobales bacterium]
MRIAALYDIHANLPALEAVLREIAQIGVDRILVGGDVVPGPMPRKTIERLSNLNLPCDFIQGNGEIAVLEELAGKPATGVPAQHRPILQWTAQQLAPADAGLLSRWPPTIQMQHAELGEVLFCHATPRNATEIFTRTTSEQRLLSTAFAGVNTAIVVCGHTHMQFDRMVGNIRVINAGSVGMPFGKPGACWLLIGSDIELRCTAYDLEKAAETVRRTNYPQAREFAEHNIVRPPAEEEMLRLFAGAEIK